MSKHKKSVEPQHPDASKSHPEGALADEDFVYVPRGKSRGTYLFILGLMVFTLIMFVVPYGLQSLVEPRGGGDGSSFMTWEHPRLGKRKVSYQEFRGHQRQLAQYFQFTRVDKDQYDERNTAAFLVTEALADEAGVEYGRSDLAEMIQQGFGSKDVYLQAMRASGLSPAEFEAIAMRVLRTQRYQGLITQAAGVPSPEDIADTWNERHQQYAFDAIGLAIEPLIETARSEAVNGDEEVLRQWYEARPPRDPAFADSYREARVAVEVVGWPNDAEPPAGLLAKYPLPDDLDPADLARQYYDANFYTRFLLDEPTTDENGNPQLYAPFEDVVEVATVEAPIHRALGLWRDELSQRLADGETVDLGAEAAALGLMFVPAGDLRPSADWRENAEDAEDGADEALDPFVGRFVEDGILRAEDGTGLSPRQIVEADALVVTRVVDRVEAGPAPFEEVTDEVIEAWSKERAAEIALERMQEAYDALSADLEEGERPVLDAEAFAAQARAMGTTVQRLDWFDPLERLPAGTDQPPLLTYGRRVARRLQLAEGEVSPPETDLKREHVWMLRGDGRRDPPEMKIKPQEYQTLQAQAFGQSMQRASELLSYDSLKARYGLSIEGEENWTEPEG